MIDSTAPSSSSRPSLADAISQVRAHGKADFLLATGQVAKLTQVKLLQNYEAILRMAGIEQTLGESIGLAPGSEALKIADAKLSRYADVPAYWILPLGELIKRAGSLQSIPGDVLNRVAELKLIRDAVMHGETDTFGEKTRKSIRETYELLLKRSKYTPTLALRARIEAVTRAKADGYQAEEMLATLGTLYRAIEAEVEIRTAMKEAGIFKGTLPHVESIFELKRASGAHEKIFQRDNLAWKFRASALVRNHLVHGTIIVPTDRQTAVVHEAHRLLGQAIAELSLKQNGGTTATGEFRNNIKL
jgi:hypothetical protein